MYAVCSFLQCLVNVCKVHGVAVVLCAHDVSPAGYTHDVSAHGVVKPLGVLARHQCERSGRGKVQVLADVILQGVLVEPVARSKAYGHRAQYSDYNNVPKFTHCVPPRLQETLKLRCPNPESGHRW